LKIIDHPLKDNFAIERWERSFEKNFIALRIEKLVAVKRGSLKFVFTEA